MMELETTTTGKRLFRAFRSLYPILFKLPPEGYFYWNNLADSCRKLLAGQVQL